MLKGISPLISPDLLSILDRMGHGDEIIFADAHFPSHSVNSMALRADGIAGPDLLNAVLPLFELDTYVDHPVAMVAPVPGDSLDPQLLADYKAVLARHVHIVPTIDFVERFAFYERARQAFAVVVTGEIRKYGNILLKKGVTLAGDD
jgi:L-fucose mutarotase